MGLQSPGIFQRPSQGQVNNFLNMPANSAAGRNASAAPPSPWQLPSNGKGFGRTVTGPGGSQITVGGVGGSRTGLGRRHRRSRPRENEGYRPRRQHLHESGRRRGRPRPWRQHVTAGRGAWSSTASSSAAIVDTGERGLHPLELFHARVERGLPGAWWPGKWAVAGTAWAMATWATAGSYCGCSGEGTYYDYGENVTYDDGNVYYGEEPVASAEQYDDEASRSPLPSRNRQPTSGFRWAFSRSSPNPRRPTPTGWSNSP